MISTTFEAKVSKFIEENQMYKPYPSEGDNPSIRGKGFNYTIFSSTEGPVEIDFTLRGTAGFHFDVQAPTVEQAFNNAFKIIKAYNLKQELPATSAETEPEPKPVTIPAAE